MLVLMNVDIHVVNVIHHLENSAVATGLEKVSFHANPKAMPKNAQTTVQLHLSHTLVK